MTKPVVDKNEDAASIKGLLHRPGRPAISVEQMEEAIREAATGGDDSTKEDRPTQSTPDDTKQGG